ncbi:MAG: AEC family transporter [Ignisphaera sp.]
MVVMFVLTVLGYMFGKIRSKIIDVCMDLVNKLLFYVVIPAIIFKAIYGSNDLENISSAIVTSGTHISLMFIISYITSYAIGIKNSKELSAIMISLSMPNVGYLAIPLSVVLIGDSRYVVPYTIAFNIVLPLLILILSIFYSTNNSSKINLVKSVPFLFSLAVSLFLKFLNIYIAVPQMIFRSIDIIILSSFVIIGYEFSKIVIDTMKSSIKFVLLGVIMRYMVSPIVLILLILQNGLINNFNYYRGLMLQSVMPPAVSNIILAKVYNLKSEIVSILTVVLTPISITITIAIFSIFLPS